MKTSAVAIRALQRLKLEIPFDSLAYHPSKNREGAEKVIGGILTAISEEDALLFLTSVSSSGSYRAIVTDICVKAGFPKERLRFVNLYQLNTGHHQPESLCELEDKPTNYSSSNCQLCTDGSRAVKVHPGLYYLKQFPERAITLKRNHFINRDFLLRNANHLERMFTFHRTSKDSRHHAFHIDIECLLADDEFVSGFKWKLRELELPPQIVYTPNDETSSKLGTIAAKEFNVELKPLDSIRDIDDTHSRVLIVDDVLVSGSRLEGYNKALREMTKGGLESVDFVVGLARPQSQESLNQTRTALTANVNWRASLRAVQTIFVPDWDERQCPWCRELNLLNRLAEQSFAPPPKLTGRISALSEREVGLKTPFMSFILKNDAGTPNLGQGSLAGPTGLSPAAVLFSVASAVQSLRADKEGLTPNYPDFRVFAARNLTNYSEGLLRAALLRIIMPEEWGQTGQLRCLEQLLERVVREPDQAILAGEILLCVDRGTLDSSILHRIKSVLENHIESCLVVPFLRLLGNAN